MNVKELPDCTKCMLQHVPTNCTRLLLTLKNCPTVIKATPHLLELERRNNALAKDREGTIRTKAYALSQSPFRMHYTSEQNWLEAERIIKLNYPELFTPFEL